MIEQLLPSSVESVEAFSDTPGEQVFPGERDLIERAVEARRREFITARRCAREALGRLGYPPSAIRPGERRAPRWPNGIVGSITHCLGFRAAAVARATNIAGLGIDAEPHEPLPEGVKEIVTSPDERAMLTALSGAQPSIHWDRLLFSAKESIYKTWFPLTGRWLGFDEARLAIDPTTARFVGQILVDGGRTDGGPPLTEVHGRYLLGDGLVLTATHVASAG